MKRVNVPNKYGLIEIDFDGHVLAECRIENGCIVVERAVDGYGNKMNID